MIDPKDLRQIKANEVPIDGYHYKKNADNSFSTCMITSNEIKNPETAAMLRGAVNKFAGEGLLFIRINRPGGAFDL